MMSVTSRGEPAVRLILSRAEEMNGAMKVQATVASVVESGPIKGHWITEHKRAFLVGRVVTTKAMDPIPESVAGKLSA
jgi:hypothetical protein